MAFTGVWTEAELRDSAAFLRSCAQRIRAEGEDPGTRRANWTTARNLERIADLREAEASRAAAASTRARQLATAMTRTPEPV